VSTRLPPWPPPFAHSFPFFGRHDLFWVLKGFPPSPCLLQELSCAIFPLLFFPQLHRTVEMCSTMMSSPILPICGASPPQGSFLHLNSFLNEFFERDLPPLSPLPFPLLWLPPNHPPYTVLPLRPHIKQTPPEKKSIFSDKGLSETIIITSGPTFPHRYWHAS